MTLKHNYLTKAGEMPSSIEILPHELVVNEVDGSLWSKSEAGDVLQVGGRGTYHGTAYVVGRGNIIDKGIVGNMNYEVFEDGTIHQWVHIISANFPLTLTFAVPFETGYSYVPSATGYAPYQAKLSVVSWMYPTSTTIDAHSFGPNGEDLDSSSLSADFWEYGSGDVRYTLDGVGVLGGTTKLFEGQAFNGETITLPESIVRFDAIRVTAYLTDHQMEGNTVISSDHLMTGTKLMNVFNFTTKAVGDIPQNSFVRLYAVTNEFELVVGAGGDYSGDNHVTLVEGIRYTVTPIDNIPPAAMIGYKDVGSVELRLDDRNPSNTLGGTWEPTESGAPNLFAWVKVAD